MVAALLHPDVWTWFYGYGNLYLAEYVLATGDKSILQELKRTTMEVALGQLGDREAASFYSRMATAAYDDREHGHCGIVWSLL
ncbi:MAG: DUF6288 domain-containing protein [Verrucomicrobiota bacterium]